MRALHIVSERPVAEVPAKLPAEKPVALRLCNVSKRFSTTVALDGFSLELRAGELVALIGPSGAGKSTLFRCITQLEPPDEGLIELAGRDVTLLTGSELRAIRRTIGLVFQQFNLIGRLNAIDNVLLGRLGSAPTWRVLSRRFTATDRQAALAALDHVGLLDRAYQRADKLSGGQQQRVAIARVLTQQATVILADEPVSSLDPGSARTVLGVLQRVARDYGKAVLCSLHQTDLARRYADRIVGLRDGRRCFDARPDDVSEERLMTLYS